MHRPHVAGIAARESEGAFSIVLSGGYEDDVVRDLNHIGCSSRVEWVSVIGCV